MKRKRVRLTLLSGMLLMAVAGSAQTTTEQRVTAAIDTVKQTGFYRIALPPQLLIKCKPDLSDLRIYRLDGMMVPYVLKLRGDSLWKPGFFPLPDPVMRQKDSSNKHSYISLSFNDTYRIDRLTTVIRHPGLYKRMAEVSAPDDSTDLNATISIDPYDTAFRLPQIRAKRLLIDINNEDNAPLVFERISAAQLNICIVTHLEAGEVYRLEGGDREAQQPSYDLHYFTDSMRQKPLDIGLAAVQTKIATVSKKAGAAADKGVAGAEERGSAGRRSTILLWSVLTLVLVLLIYISVRMVKTIAKKETNDRL